MGRQLTVDPRGWVHLQVEGMRIGSLASVWGMSTPVLLDQVLIDPTHRGVAQFALAASMLAGNHTLVVSGTTAGGSRATLMVGIVIRGSATGNAPTGAAPARTAPASPGPASATRASTTPASTAPVGRASASTAPTGHAAAGGHTGGVGTWVWSLLAAGSVALVGTIFLTAWRRRNKHVAV